MVAVTPLGNDVAAAVSDLKRQDGPDLLIQGSQGGACAHLLGAADRIDDEPLRGAPGLLDPVDKHTFVVGLVEVAGQAERLGSSEP